MSPVRVVSSRTLLCLLAWWSTATLSREAEPFIAEPLPPGFSVQATELDGPVFADARGRTLYRWPFRVMRNGVTGDARGESNCGTERSTESAGLMSPYPAGLLLPELDTRPSCAEAWPPALAAAKAKPVGKWSVIERRDGQRQWAYDGAALYTSVLDRRAGDVLGADTTGRRGDTPVLRVPVQPAPDVPPGFAVTTSLQGRLLHTTRGFSVYASDADRRNRSNCDTECAKTWPPMLAPASARPHGDWSIVKRADGERQWAFRGRALYRHAGDTRVRSLEGSDVAGWHNVYTQPAPPPPAGFTVQDTPSGQVLADASGHTIYVYACGDDALDQLGCDHPTETQIYRLALCGAGSAERCLRNFPYVEAPKGARSRSRAWSVIEIDPLTGRLAARGQPGALRVWAFRDRPVYTFAGDEYPGEVNADGYGEFRAQRQGYRAYWLRDDFFREG